MENQQQQQPVMPSTNDFLSRMDMSNNMGSNEPEKKGPSKGLIIGIIVGILAIVGIVVAIIMMNSSNAPAPTPTQTSYVDPGPEIDEEMEARNELRQNDLLPVREAINAYQATKQSDGQLPGTVDDWNYVIETYGPEGGIVDGADGELYKMSAICKFSENCVDIKSLTWEENKHEIFAYINADCKGDTKDNVIVSSTRARRVAIFSIIEGDKFICTTNGTD